MNHSTGQQLESRYGTTFLKASLGSVALLSACLVTDSPRPSEATLVPHKQSRPAKLRERTQKKKQIREIVQRYAPNNQKAPMIADLIVRRSLRAKFDPLFVAAIIKSESTFRPNAVSHKGARGLMQVTAIAEREMIRRGRISRRVVSIENPGYNIDLGLRYLRQLEQQFGGNRMIALVAYNCGPTTVLKALDGDNRIPAESFRYARTILDDHQSWVGQG
jgi:soluble lytic murein transglycosylase-like protein